MSQRDFDSLFASILGEGARDGTGQIEMVLADKDLTVRARLHPAQEFVVTDMFVRGLRGFRAEGVPALHRALLVVNDVAARIGDFSVGIDEREILILTGRSRLEGLTRERYLSAFAVWLEQVDLLRETVAAIGMENFTLTFIAPDANPAQETRA